MFWSTPSATTATCDFECWNKNYAYKLYIYYKDNT